MFVARPALLLLAVLAAGCAARSNNPSNRNIISAEQIAGARVHNAHDAVLTLQPDWLSSRGPTSMTDPTPTGVSVYANGIQLGGADALRRIDVNDVIEIRYYPAGPASARFGMGHPRGVIEVVTRTDQLTAQSARAAESQRNAEQKQ